MIESGTVSLAPQYAIMKNEFWQFLQSHASFPVFIFPNLFPPVLASCETKLGLAVGSTQWRVADSKEWRGTHCHGVGGRPALLDFGFWCWLLVLPVVYPQ